MFPVNLNDSKHTPIKDRTKFLLQVFISHFNPRAEGQVQ